MNMADNINMSLWTHFAEKWMNVRQETITSIDNVYVKVEDRKLEEKIQLIEDCSPEEEEMMLMMFKKHKR